MAIETVAPDADSTAGGWTTDAGGSTNLFATLDETTASDTDYIRSPVRSAVAPDLIVRLKRGATTIATWTHTGIGTSYVDAVQTLTAPQLAAITDFTDLFIEFDDNGGNVYRSSLGNPTGTLTTPVTVSYRYKALAAAAGYQGPGDIVSGFLAFWGMRAFSAASIAATRPVIAIVRDDVAPTTTPTDFVCLANGDLDVAAITTFLAGHAGAIVKYYDQTGNGNHIIHPGWALGGLFTDLHVFVASDLNSKPTTLLNSSDGSYQTAAAITQAQPFSHSCVIKSTQSAARGAVTGDFSAGGPTSFGQDNVADQWYVTDGSFGPLRNFTATNGAFHAIQLAHVSGAPVVKVDGAAAVTLADAGSGGITNIVGMGTDGGGARLWSGSFAELGLWTGAFNSTQMGDLYANQNAYWGV